MPAATYHICRGQGATEYLVLLAVVLIVALVSVALLGFFPGMASDAQMTQSKTYWASMQPISIIEAAARRTYADSTTRPYIRLKNSGAYPIRITGFIGGDGNKATQFYGDNCGVSSAFVNISNYFYLGPGEEKYISSMGPSWYGTVCDWRLYTWLGASSSGPYLGSPVSECQNSSLSPGMLQFNSFGFEYIEYLDNNQQITKREIGTKPLVIKCMEPM